MKTWRLIDTGLRSAAENIALDRALLEARAMNLCPSTLRFLRFTPSALVGFHQAIDQELDRAYCMDAGIEIQRRLSGGGAIYFDPGALGWELFLAPEDLPVRDMAGIACFVCEAAAEALVAMGVDARFRPRNDIEVDGRKLSGTGGVWAETGDALLYQGTLLVRFDVDTMLACLRIPKEKLADKAILEARARITDLATLLATPPSREVIVAQFREAFARRFGVRFEPGELSQEEERLFVAALREVRRPEWLERHRRPLAEAPLLVAMRKFPAGLVRVALILDAPRQRIKQIQFTGDFFVHPSRWIADLEAALKDLPVAKLGDAILVHAREHPADLGGLRPEDFVATAQAALAGAG